MIGLAGNIKPKNTELTMAVLDIMRKKLFLVSPDEDSEKWFVNFLNSIEKKGVENIPI